MINLIAFLLVNVMAQNSSIQLNESKSSTSVNVKEEDTIYVIGSKEKAFFTPGSAHFVDQKELETFSYKDVSRVLDKVPGVYIQEEDGLGLRPNIGLRGAHPHRSKKVTLMEDGVLVAPAPYAAPAAYYFPSTSKISSMEVYKGPSSVQYGPNSVGGAINMVTRPFKNEKMIEVSGGSFNEVHAYGGNKNWLVEGVHKEGDLLKQLPGGVQPEFQQNDIQIKYRGNVRSQKFILKASFANEDSGETYLGTSISDFNNDPFTRYQASQDDRMKWHRYAVAVNHQTKLTENLKIKSTLYHHYLNRNWEKFNNLNFNQDFRTALSTGNDPDDLIALLKGERNSSDYSEFFKIGSNSRSYFSQGLQTVFGLSVDTGSIAHNIDLGIRLHRDQIRRNHTEKLAAMVGGDLAYQDNTYQTTNRNQDTSRALAVFLQDEILWGDLSTKIGFRTERVEHERDPRNGENIQSNSESVFVPGIGFNYSLTNNLVALAGVNKGVTLVGPGQADGIAPEEAINYELGFRLKAPVYLESIAFYSDYQNLKGNCSFSTGCDENNLDTEYNGGKAEVYGIESLVSHQLNWGKWSFPVKLSHTFTVARFKNELVNSNPEWGPIEGENRTIRVNDPMPYIPQNQIGFGSGVGYGRIAFDLNLLWKGRMADQAVAENRRIIPSYGVIDTALSYGYSTKGKAFLRVNNLLDNTYLVSLRPFGARAGSPRTVVAGFNQRF